MTKVSQQLTNPDAVDKIARLLKSKASTPRPLTLSELLDKVKFSVSKMFKNGHSIADVVQLLSEYQVVVTESALSAYFSGANKVKGSKGKGKEKDSSELASVVIEADRAEVIIKAFAERSSIRKGLTREELVAQLREPIANMLAAGYTYSDIAAVMAEMDIHISPATIKRYYQGNKSRQSAVNTDESNLTAAGTDSVEVNQKNSTISNEETSEKSSKSKTSKLSEADSPIKGNKRFKESASEQEKDLEKEFNL